MTSAPIGTPASLTSVQRQRLLSGAWSLARLWETLRTTPPTFDRQDECNYHKLGCMSTWSTVWREIGKTERTLKHALRDVLGRLREMEEQLSARAQSSALMPYCKRNALAVLETTIKRVQEGLGDHFSNLTLVQEKVGAESSEASS